MEIKIGEKKFELKELKYLDIVELANINDKRNHALKILELSGIKKEDAESLTITEGKIVMDEINKLNGFNSDFQKTSKVEETS